MQKLETTPECCGFKPSSVPKSPGRAGKQGANLLGAWVRPSSSLTVQHTGLPKVLSPAPPLLLTGLRPFLSPTPPLCSLDAQTSPFSQKLSEPGSLAVSCLCCSNGTDGVPSVSAVLGRVFSLCRDDTVLAPEFLQTRTVLFGSFNACPEASIKCSS